MAKRNGESRTNPNVREGTNMKKVGVYSFFDKEAGVWNTPFFAKDDLFARRHWLIQLDDEKSMLRKFIDQYELIRIGTFDTENGDFERAMDDAEKYVVLKGINVAKEYFGGNKNGET